jgi:hypothetical protein
MTMYTDYYLKFSDEPTALSVLYRTEGAIEADPEMGVEASPGYQVPNYTNIDILGVIYEEQEITDPENLPEPIPMDGWHVNIRLVEGEDSTPLELYIITPETPRRVWA